MEIGVKWFGLHQSLWLGNKPVDTGLEYDSRIYFWLVSVFGLEHFSLTSRIVLGMKVFQVFIHENFLLGEQTRASLKDLGANRILVNNRF